MEFYAAVRRSVYVEGLSERAAARRFGLARETVRKMLRYRLPPGYRRAKLSRAMVVMACISRSRRRRAVSGGAPGSRQFFFGA